MFRLFSSGIRNCSKLVKLLKINGILLSSSALQRITLTQGEDQCHMQHILTEEPRSSAIAAQPLQGNRQTCRSSRDRILALDEANLFQRKLLLKQNSWSYLANLLECGSNAFRCQSVSVGRLTCVCVFLSVCWWFHSTDGAEFSCVNSSDFFAVYFEGA